MCKRDRDQSNENFSSFDRWMIGWLDVYKVEGNWNKIIPCVRKTKGSTKSDDNLFLYCHKKAHTLQTTTKQPLRIFFFFHTHKQNGRTNFQSVHYNNNTVR